MKNILISAYACDPFGVSECSVGWNIVKHLAESTKDYNIVVVTQKNDQVLHTEENINKYRLEHKMPDNLFFHCFDHPSSWIRYKIKKGHYIYYWLWQRRLVSEYKKLEKLYGGFELVHHLTFVTINQNMYLYKCNKNFIWGPLGGAELTPYQLLKSARIQKRIFESVRRILVKTRRLNPNFLLCARNAKKIIIVNNDTKKFFSKYNKVEVIPAIGYSKDEFSVNYQTEKKKIGKLKIITVAVMEYRKGIDIILNVARKLKGAGFDFEISLIGDGPEKHNYQEYVRKNGLEQCIHFYGKIPHEDTLAKMRASDVMLFPSRRDSGGFVAIEAIKSGIPVICLDLGGPAETIKLDKSFGWAIDVCQDENRIIDEIVHLLGNYDFKNHVVNSGILDDTYLWERKAEKILELYKRVLSGKADNN